MTKKDTAVIKGIKTKDTAYTGPYGVQIGLTGRCNYRCRFCGFFSPVNLAKNNNLSNGDIPLKDFYRLIDTLHKLKVEQISLVGWGEPLIHKDIIEMISYIKEKGMRCMLTTNGALLDKDRISKLIEYRLDIMYISFNAATPDTYKFIHGIKNKKTFENILSSLRFLKDKKRENHLKTPALGLRMVICKYNFKEVPALFNIAEDISADSVTLQEWSYFNAGEPIGLNKGEIESLLQILKKLNDTINKKISHNIPYFIDRLSYLLSKDKKTDSLSKGIPYPCYVGWMYAMIMHNGNVLPCCNCNKVMGNIFKEDFEKIWNNDIYKHFRKDTIDIMDKPYKEEGCLCYVTCGSVMHNKRMHEMINSVQLSAVSFQRSDGDGEGDEKF